MTNVGGYILHLISGRGETPRQNTVTNKHWMEKSDIIRLLCALKIAKSRVILDLGRKQRFRSVFRLLLLIQINSSGSYYNISFCLTKRH